ncbi:ABC transporter permease [Paenibacillus apiarius]|uniref:ABC transporter permease n=1 Tax=Paenibacillus apiarius TaxID=46240 RepID=A0ABT4DN67_9BACL|nr:ABC transporter permease [Paenibacillus apiarius]MCY9514691.1 ABC transporter permease [Paenibacillus apiarius]MCY9518681.1 ABC transporter permease [Paenibacillus apiarius]MCY9552878.1 ABC transporter permease [Paenibacillus apiarius]MCY9556903.1 ABC transporter permease [Paenibacillus apiarius]MCY9686144.1 ABC transporter permease [Paenibacillus apiarius]
MNRAAQLLLSDMKQVKRDPMLIFIAVAPLLLVLALKYGVPLVSAQFAAQARFDLTVHYGVLFGTSVLLIPLVIGVMAGLLMLDERDEQLIAYYAITPLSQKGYFIHRLTLPTLLSGIYILLAFVMADFSAWSAGQYGFAFAMLLLEGPMMALLLTSFASNKVEGLAWSKLGGLLIFIPVLACLLPEPWRWGAAVTPTFWVIELFVHNRIAQWNEPELLLVGGIGLGVHLIFITVLYRKYASTIA